MSGGAAACPSDLDLPTAGQTIVSFTLRPVAAQGPWPLTRVLTALGEFDMERVGVARAIGDHRGIPLLHSQELRWGDNALHVEARHARGGPDEIAIELPSWDELTASTHAGLVWRLIDAVAVASDARFGSVGDGEAPETSVPEGAAELAAHLRRHHALLLPEWVAPDVAEAGAHLATELDSSGLLVVVAAQRGLYTSAGGC